MDDNLNFEEEKVLGLRMYFFVPYNISGRQMGIQAGHAALRYARMFSEENRDVWDFVDNHETWIILNGGTTNSDRDFDDISIGSINKIADYLVDKDINFSYFIEPDLNNALSAICFLCDERVFNNTDYPNFIDWLLNIKMYDDAKNEAFKNNPTLWIELKTQTIETLSETFPEYYKEWVRFIGGMKNVYLREIIKNKKLA